MSVRVHLDDPEKRLAVETAYAKAAGTKKKDKKRLMLYLEPELYDRLKALAERSGMSMNKACHHRTSNNPRPRPVTRARTQ